MRSYRCDRGSKLAERLKRLPRDEHVDPSDEMAHGSPAPAQAFRADVRMAAKEQWSQVRREEERNRSHRPISFVPPTPYRFLEPWAQVRFLPGTPHRTADPATEQLYERFQSRSVA